MKRSLLLLGLAGCATVTPMQTASVVENGNVRVGGQLSMALYCGNYQNVGPGLCSQYPDGVPLPELRVGARRGLPAESDVGLSLQLAGQLFAPSRPVQVGLTFDAKKQWVLSTSATGVRQVLSAAILTGAAVSGRLGLPPYVQLEVGANLFYGVQTARFEWVLGLSISERQLFNEVGGRPALPRVGSERLGFTLGLFRREPAGWAFQLGYLTNLSQLDAGAILLQYGVFWDLTGWSAQRAGKAGESMLVRADAPTARSGFCHARERLRHRQVNG